MVVMVIGWAFVFMRIAWPVIMIVVMVVAMFVAMFVHDGDDFAGVCREGTSVHADQHAENHDGLKKESHIDAAKIGERVHGSRHFGFGPFLDMIAHDGCVVACISSKAKARCGRS